MDMFKPLRNIVTGVVILVRVVRMRGLRQLEVLISDLIYPE
jgi:hypothetical protein